MAVAGGLLAIRDSGDENEHFGRRFRVEEKNKKRIEDRSRSEEPRRHEFVQSEFGEIPPELRAKLLNERDEIWRLHERAQIAFLQNEHGNMLRALYEEMERLHNQCRDLQSEKLGLSGTVPEQVKHKISSLEQELNALKLDNSLKDEQVRQFKEKLNAQEQYHREQAKAQSARIKELTQQLNSKQALMAQLSSQLHNLRLREAVDRQKAVASPGLIRSYPMPRFRLSTAPAGSSRPPPPLIRHSSVTVSNPSKRPSLPPLHILPVGGSIEKPSGSSYFQRKLSAKQSSNSEQL